VDFSQAEFPYRGEVLWLTPEQGGRRNGPPPDPAGYASIAHVPPGNAEADSASFVLRGWDPEQWRSSAEGRWLVGEEVPQFGETGVGAVIAVTEGTRLVAYFTVEEVVP
jgi:hypothetical protein